MKRKTGRATSEPRKRPRGSTARGNTRTTRPVIKKKKKKKAAGNTDPASPEGLASAASPAPGSGLLREQRGATTVDISGRENEARRAPQLSYRPKKIKVRFRREKLIEIKPDQPTESSLILQANTKPIEEADDRLTNLRHLERLADAMSPDPKDYEYRGEMDDVGEYGRQKCACGHPIRYIFTVRRKKDNRPVQIGSVCIETSVFWLMSHGNEELARALEGAVTKLQTQIAEARRREREARANKDVTAVMEEWSKLTVWHENARTIWRRSIYSYLPQFLLKRPNPLKAHSTAGRTLSAAIRVYCTLWIKALDATRSTDLQKLLSPPQAPTHKGLRKGLRAALLREYAQEELRAKYRIPGLHSAAENERFNSRMASYKEQADALT